MCYKYVTYIPDLVISKPLIASVKWPYIFEAVDHGFIDINK